MIIGTLKRCNHKLEQRCISTHMSRQHGRISGQKLGFQGPDIWQFLLFTVLETFQEGWLVTIKLCWHNTTGETQVLGRMHKSCMQGQDNESLTHPVFKLFGRSSTQDEWQLC